MRFHLLAALMCAAAPALAGTPKASSELRDDDGKRHSASMAFDGRLQTGWAEAVGTGGAGEWLELRLDRETQVESVSIWPGNLERGLKSLKEYGRPSKLKVTLIGSGPEEEWPTKEVRIDDGAITGPARVDVVLSGKAKSVRIELVDVNQGIVYNDTFIAEVAVNFTRGDRPSSVKAAIDWAAGSGAAKSAERNSKEIIELFETIKATEFGDKEALTSIMERAADGAPHVRVRVAKYVPAGYRMAALPPDDKAVDALLKLRDPNGIPGLELASIRVKGKQQGKLEKQVDYFYAFQELVGGPNAVVPPWGELGWGEGAIQSFGEPPNLEIDQLGQVIIADTGNHRVQRYGTNGLPNGDWGASTQKEDKTDQITNVWIGGKRDFYVAAHPPGDKPGQFSNPLDVAIRPGKDFDAYAVLDNNGRVQLMDERGNVTLEWRLQTENTLEATVGGQGFIVNAKGKLVIIWGAEAFVYDSEAEELGRFEIEDGPPVGAVALKNGKLGLLIDQDMIMYSTDGFRHGSVLGDTLPSGFESWDATIDIDGRLWAVTDTGWAIKYKKPGKVEYKVRFTERALPYLRIAAQDDKVYMLQDDHIEIIDVLDLHTKAEAEALEGAGDDL